MKISIKSNNLKEALSYVNPAVGISTSANPESTLVYIHVLNESNKAVFQVQSTYLTARVISEIEDCSDLEDQEFIVIVDFLQLYTYVRNSKKSETFIFELDDTDLDILSIKISDKLIGTVGTMPRDAYEVQTFKNTIEICTLETSFVQSLIEYSTQFANVKEDTEDFIQILGKDNTLTFFTVNNEVLAKFESDELDLEDESLDFDISVKASALKKINNFLTDELTLSLTDDEYSLVLKEKGKGLRAVVTYTDPPGSFQEYEDEFIEENSFELGWSVNDMSDALKNISCSTKDGYLNFNINKESNINLQTESNINTMTKVKMPITTLNYEESLQSQQFRASIPLFKKLGTLNKNDGKVTLKFNYEKDSMDEDFIKVMTCEGCVNQINYSITFDVLGI